MTRRQSYDAATPYYGEPQPYEKEIAKLKAEVARAEEAAGDFQELERINTELAHNLSTAKKQAGAWLNATADAKLEITRLRADLAAVTEERDALLAHLAPVDDDILLEIAAMHFARIDGHSDNWDRYVDEAKDYIDAIRPHIEAVERERCAKIAETPDLWVTDKPSRGCDDIAAAIRSGK